MVDNSCGFTADECAERQEGISDLISAIKSANTLRLMYLRIDDTDYDDMGDNLLVLLGSAAHNDLSNEGECIAVMNQQQLM